MTDVTVSYNTVEISDASVGTATVEVGLSGPQGPTGEPATPKTSSTLIMGHSYMDDAGVGVVSSIYSTGRRVKEIFGTPDGRYKNIAVSGGTAAQHTGSSSWASVLRNYRPNNNWPYNPDFGTIAINYGTNDAIQGTGAVYLSAFRESMKTIVGRAIASKVYLHNNNETNGVFTLTGDWEEYRFAGEATPPGDGDGYWVTDTVGAYLEFTTPEDFDTGYIHIGFVGGEDGATASIRIDGVLWDTVSTNGIWSGASNRVGVIARVPVDDGDHTIRVTCDGVTAAGELRVNYWQIESAHHPVTLVANMSQPSDPQFIWAGLADPDVAIAYNEIIDEVVAWFNSPYIKVADIWTALGGSGWTLNSNSRYYSTDGLHPNEYGTLVIANTVFTAANEVLVAGGSGDHLVTPWLSQQDTWVSGQNQIHAGYGTPFGITDAFDTAFDIDGLGGDWEEVAGRWGINDSMEARVYSSTSGVPTVDTFQRADSASTLGSPWTSNVGTWGISNYQAYLVTSAGARNIATVDAGVANHFVSMKIGSMTGGVYGMIFRYVDANNYAIVAIAPGFGTGAVYEVVGGVLSGVISSALMTQSVGTEVAVEVTGNNFVVYSNGAVSFSGSINAALAAGTRVGLYATPAGVAARFSEIRWGSYTGTNGSGASLAVIDSGWADGSVGLRRGKNFKGLSGLAFRVTDRNNYLRFVKGAGAFNAWWFFQTVESGVVTTIAFGGDLYEQVAGTTDDVVVKMDGSTFYFYFGGTLWQPGAITIDYSYGGYTTQTKHGLVAANDQYKAVSDTFAAYMSGEVLISPIENDQYIDTKNNEIYRNYDLSDGWGTPTPLGAGGVDVKRIVIDGGGFVPSTGAASVYLDIPYDCELVKWRILADASGDIVFDIWKDTYANFPPTNSDSICGSGTKPTLSAAQKGEGTNFSGYITTDFSAGDILEVEIESVSTITKVYLDLFLRRT